MTPESFRVIAQYNRWMNTSLYEAAARLTDEERDVGATDLVAMLRGERPL